MSQKPGAPGGGTPGGSKRRKPLPPGPKVDKSAIDLLRETLEGFGLGSLVDWAWEQHVNGLSDTEILIALRERQEYKTRFAGMEARKKAGLAPISEAEYVAWEAGAQSILKAAGLPASFYDESSDFTNFIAGDVSVAELRSRVNDGYVAMMSAPKEVQDEFRRFYMGRGDMAAYWIDPERAQPLLMRQFAAARAGGAAVSSGFGEVTASEAEMIAAYGNDPADGFGTLARSRELMSGLPGSEDDTISRADQFGAMFGGDQAARERIEKRGRQRAGEFQGGGAFAGGDRGVSGLGSASQ